MPNVIEVLQYTLKPGTGDAFHSIMKCQSVPLHTSCGINVLRFGNSLHDNDNYYLVREFENLAKMEAVLAQFYADSRWREGPRSEIISMIQKATVLSCRATCPSREVRFQPHEMKTY